MKIIVKINISDWEDVSCIPLTLNIEKKFRPNSIQCFCIYREQYKAAQSLPIVDDRLFAMCEGIWARLKYLYSLRKTQQQTINV